MNNESIEKELYNLKNWFNRLFRKSEPEYVNKKNAKNAIIATILYAVLYYYFLLPPLNIRSTETWFYIWSILFVLIVIGGKNIKGIGILKKIAIFIVFLFIILQIPGLKIFRAKSYSNIINITESNFNEDIKELSISEIPTLDRESSIRVGARKMGELYDLVSQFNIDEDTYTQINYQNKPVRVTPLKYNGFIKYLTNMKEGIPGIIKIDIVNGEAELIRLKDKIKISKNDYFFRDVTRYARLRYPFDIFIDINFEIDDNGIPFWIIPTYKPKIAVFNALDVDGAILVNAITGEHKKYELSEIPEWIDRIYNSESIIEQLNWSGSLKSGFFNSIFSQKNVLKTTEGYNYLALDDDIYLYTGYTSVSSDQSNVGFLLVNQRTKETKFYPVSSAEEFSAMESAQGEVQEKGYIATFPLLLNIHGNPTYFLSLKDNAGLIKQYAFIDAKDYQRVSVGTTVSQALQNYNLEKRPSDDSEQIYEDKLEHGIIEDIQSVVIDGNTHYYFTLTNSDKVFVANLKLSERLPLIKAGSIISFTYHEKQVNEVIYIESIKIQDIINDNY